MACWEICSTNHRDVSCLPASVSNVLFVKSQGIAMFSKQKSGTQKRNEKKQLDTRNSKLPKTWLKKGQPYNPEHGLLFEK